MRLLALLVALAGGAIVAGRGPSGLDNLRRHSGPPVPKRAGSPISLRPSTMRQSHDTRSGSAPARNTVGPQRTPTDGSGCRSPGTGHRQDAADHRPAGRPPRVTIEADAGAGQGRERDRQHFADGLGNVIHGDELESGCDKLGLRRQFRRSRGVTISRRRLSLVDAGIAVNKRGRFDYGPARSAPFHREHADGGGSERRVGGLWPSNNYGGSRPREHSSATLTSIGRSHNRLRGAGGILIDGSESSKPIYFRSRRYPPPGAINRQT